MALNIKDDNYEAIVAEGAQHSNRSFHQER